MKSVALFLSTLRIPDYQIGLLITLTLLGDVFVSGFLTFVADQWGRRKSLIGASSLMVASGMVFTFSDDFWTLLAAAAVGVMSTTGGDSGPFRSIEE